MPRRSTPFTGPASSTGSPITFMMRPSVAGPTGIEIGPPVSVHLLAAHQAFGGVHGDGAHRRFAEMLGDLEHQPVAAVLGFQRVEDRRQVAFELHVDDGADDLGDLSDCVLRGRHVHLSLKLSAQAAVNVTGTLPRVARE